jgi:hypothetical protein
VKPGNIEPASTASASYVSRRIQPDGCTHGYVGIERPATPERSISSRVCASAYGTSSLSER